MEILTQHYYVANQTDLITARVIFSTSNNVNSIPGFDTTPFFGCATCHTNGYSYNQDKFIIKQNSATSYSFLMYMAEDTGNGVLRISKTTGDTFAYSGTVLTPSGCYIKPV